MDFSLENNIDLEGEVPTNEQKEVEQLRHLPEFWECHETRMSMSEFVLMKSSSSVPCALVWEVMGVGLEIVKKVKLDIVVLAV